MALLGVTGALPEWLEWLFLSASLVIGTLALRHGHRGHGQMAPLRLFVVGISALLVARVTGLTGPWETIVVVVGATILIAAHAVNWREGRRCIRCAPGTRATDVGE
jgi:hypothetical protein